MLQDLFLHRAHFITRVIVVFLEISWSTDQQSRSSSSMQTFKLASVLLCHKGMPVDLLKQSLISYSKDIILHCIESQHAGSAGRISQVGCLKITLTESTNVAKSHLNAESLVLHVHNVSQIAVVHEPAGLQAGCNCAHNLITAKSARAAVT